MKIIYLMLGLAIAACGIGLFSGWCIWDEDVDPEIIVLMPDDPRLNPEITMFAPGEYTVQSYHIENTFPQGVNVMIGIEDTTYPYSIMHCAAYEGYFMGSPKYQIDFTRKELRKYGYYLLADYQIQSLKDQCKWNYCDD